MSKKSKKRKVVVEEKPPVDEEQETFFTDALKEEMGTMWEIPQVFHFLCLAKDALNITHLSMYEVERMLFIPRASKQLASIMTSLLSPSITKAKLRKLPLMPYEFWTNIVAHKMKSWFKVYNGKHRDAIKVLETIGVEPEFWNFFPDASLVDGKDFEELNFKQRVWLLKTICDTIMHTRKMVQEEISKQPTENQCENLLGCDRYGTRYIYFPQFVGSDLRIYSHCLDNKILSSAKIELKPKPKVEVKTMSETTNVKIVKNRKRKSRWRNGLSTKTKKRVTNCNKKLSDSNKFRINANEDRLTTDDDAMSSHSNTNNNHINLKTMNRKQTRSSSKLSEESISSRDTVSGTTQSSSYKGKAISDDKLGDIDVPHNMFKGFSNVNTETSNMAVISEILDGLKAEIDTENPMNNGDAVVEKHAKQQSSNEIIKNDHSASSSESTRRAQLNIVHPHGDRDGFSESSGDNQSNSSKTDDEKLNEMNGVDNSKYTDEFSVRNSYPADNASQIFTVSKSDDEKLNETKAHPSNTNRQCNSIGEETITNNNAIDLPEDTSEMNEQSDCKQVEKNHVPTYDCRPSTKRLRDKFNLSQAKPDLERKVKRKGRTKLQDTLPEKTSKEQNENSTVDIKSEVDKDTGLDEFRNWLQTQTLCDDYDDCSDDPSEQGYNLRNTKETKSERWTKEAKNFNDLLCELSISDFRLVADNVEALRNLISKFSPENKNSNDTFQTEHIPTCEIRLAKKLNELLNSVEKLEPMLKEATRRAKGKLQKEWTNFKEGVEDQDSSGESGLSSNWWVLGSQGCSLPAPGDATLQTLPQSALSPIGSQNQIHRSEVEPETHSGHREQQNQCKIQQPEAEPKFKDANSERQRHSAEDKEGGENCKDLEKSKLNEGEVDKDSEQKPRRVLRARGVSSYTEQFYSDEEIDENQLDERASFAAIYPASSTPVNTSTLNSPTKIGHDDDWSEEEDSDQDWILPSSRKRKNKRPSANRRLKSFQHKIQIIQNDTFQDKSAPSVPIVANAKNNKEKNKSGETKESQLRKSDIPQASSVTAGLLKHKGKNAPMQAVPSLESSCKTEIVDSVHSELDIKDEGPIFDSVTTSYENSYSMNHQQGYIMVNANENPMDYYVMQENPPMSSNIHQSPLVEQSSIVSNFIPPVQPALYVHNPHQNYVIQNTPANYFIAPRQPMFQQGPQMLGPQQFVTHSAYPPYMMSQPPPGFISMHPPKQQFLTQNIQQALPAIPNSTQAPNTLVNNRLPEAQTSFRHPSGAVIRSNMPIKRNVPKAPQNRPQKSNAPQQRAPNLRNQQVNKTNLNKESTVQKTTSLIVLSDSDDEIEMIITEKMNDTSAEKGGSSVPSTDDRQQQQSPVDSEVPVSKGVIPPQIIQRMNQGGISITPVKSAAPVQNASTQLVVVVNDTGSHYALALPNGSKLILTPEQVAHIRASNGGKLVL